MDQLGTHCRGMIATFHAQPVTHDFRMFEPPHTGFARERKACIGFRNDDLPYQIVFVNFLCVSAIKFELLLVSNILYFIPYNVFIY